MSATSAYIRELLKELQPLSLSGHEMKSIMDKTDNTFADLTDCADNITAVAGSIFNTLFSSISNAPFNYKSVEYKTLRITIDVSKVEKPSKLVSAPRGSLISGNYVTKYGLAFDMNFTATIFDNLQEERSLIVFQEATRISLPMEANTEYGDPPNYSVDIPMTHIFAILSDTDRVVFDVMHGRIDRSEPNFTPRRNKSVNAIVDALTNLSCKLEQIVAWYSNYVTIDTSVFTKTACIKWMPTFRPVSAGDALASSAESLSVDSPTTSSPPEEEVVLESNDETRTFDLGIELKHARTALALMLTNIDRYSSVAKRLMQLSLLTHSAKHIVTLYNSIEEVMQESFIHAIGTEHGRLVTNASELLSEINISAANSYGSLFTTADELTGRSCNVSFEVEFPASPRVPLPTLSYKTTESIYVRIYGSDVPMESDSTIRAFVLAAPRNLVGLPSICVSGSSKIGSPSVVLLGNIDQSTSRTVVIPFAVELLKDGNHFKALIDVASIPNNKEFHDRAASLPQGAYNMAKLLREKQLRTSAIAVMLFDPRILISQVVGLSQHQIFGKLEKSLIGLVCSGGCLQSLYHKDQTPERLSDEAELLHAEIKELRQNAEIEADALLAAVKRQRQMEGSDDEEEPIAYRSMATFRGLSASTPPPPPHSAQKSGNSTDSEVSDTSNKSTLATILDSVGTLHINHNFCSGAVLKISREMTVGKSQFPAARGGYLLAPKTFEAQSKEDRELHMHCFLNLIKSAASVSKVMCKTTRLSGIFTHYNASLVDHLIQGGDCPIDQMLMVSNKIHDNFKNVEWSKEVKIEEGGH